MSHVISILPIWKPVGFSTHIIAKNVALLNDLKTSHTGTLDPMAQGVIIVLLGDERNKKYDYASWEKLYEFEIALGIKTDTFDGLGIPDLCDKEKILNLQFQEVQTIIQKYKGFYSQKAPIYSTKKIKGKPLHWYARNAKINEVDLPTINGEIFNIDLCDISKKSFKEILSIVTNNVSLVTGDLRQKQIIKAWKNLYESNRTAGFFVLKVAAKVSKGIYIRQLAVDIANDLQTCGFVLDLVRTANGIYTQENSKTLSQVFGHNFEEKFDFTSSQKYKNKLN